MEVLQQSLEYRAMLFQLQLGKHVEHDQRRCGVLGVRAYTHWNSFGIQESRLHAKTPSFCPRLSKKDQCYLHKNATIVSVWLSDSSS